jgi:hypothetical protein
VPRRVRPTVSVAFTWRGWGNDVDGVLPNVFEWGDEAAADGAR